MTDQAAQEVLGTSKPLHDQILGLMHTFAKMHPKTLGRDVVEFFAEKHQEYLDRWVDIAEERREQERSDKR